MKPFTVTIMTVDKPNKNNRIYSRETMQKAIDEVNEKKQGRVFGTIGMPEGNSVELGKVSHIAGNLRIDDDGQVLADIMVLDTPEGAKLREILKTTSTHSSSATIPSSRGMQDVINVLKPENIRYDYRTAGYGEIVERADGVKEVVNFTPISVSLVLDGA